MAENGTKLFGTDGIRARYGEEPLTPPILRRIGAAIAAVLDESPKQSRAKAPRRVLIGRDTRPSGPEILDALSAGLAQGGYSVYDLGVVTTPGVAYCVKNLGAASGIVISASHNPSQDNGIKIFGPDGFKLADELEEAIERKLSALSNSNGAGASALRPAHEHVLAYRDHLEACARGVAGTSKPFAGMTLAIDCANGAAHALAPAVFETLGAAVHPVACSGDGKRINEKCGALHPETLIDTVLKTKADAGITFDGDGDRVMLVSPGGAILDGDHMLAALARWLKAENALGAPRIVGTVMANIGLELALVEHGIELVRETVGDRYVVARMLRDGLMLGGEQSGHVIIFQRGSTTGDGMFTALNILSRLRRDGASLDDVAKQVTRYPQILLNIPVKEKRPFDRMPAVVTAHQRVNGELGKRGRVVLRYSGTESLARVMVEGVAQDQIARCAGEIAEAIRREIGRDER
ncbi:MAG: phosphoglucosamine mutase [Planctomycetes bacterium]|nr:phosphoglucosamine mutase [Planctomycetota bacterium]